MEDLDYTIGVLRELRSLDIRIGIDDFGTGYSSLAHLRSFPVDFLKIDRSFVMDIGTERGDGAIVATIINLAHNLGMAAIAEGVETQLQLATLAQLGCDLAQGFGIAKPVTLQKLLGPESSADLVGS
jgi:EAL domain-containing protein (putative c-di-GMP-specific phosphodiesterase class I)